MKAAFKKCAYIIILALALSAVSVTAFAADNGVTYLGKDKGFDFGGGSEYTATDLFDNFKGVMPGDRLSDTVVVKNEADGCDYVKVYLRVAEHDEQDNPPVVESDETVATMTDFLGQLTMRIYNGDVLIYESSPDKSGALTEALLLGELQKGESLDLNVQLDVPIELDNRYANRVGEVDWIFSIEERYYPVSLTVKKEWVDDTKGRPDSVTVALCNGDVCVETVVLNDDNNWQHIWAELEGDGDWSVKEVSVPRGYKATYKTEDGVTTITNTSTLIQTGQLKWPVPVMSACGCVLIALGTVMTFCKKREDRA